MPFVDFSSAFNTISPMKLIGKLQSLGLNTTLCNWILDFLINRPQQSDLLHCNAEPLSRPGLCAQPPLVHAVHSQPQSQIWRELLRTTPPSARLQMMRLQPQGNLQSYVKWCKENNLLLNVSKTKELIVRKKERKTHNPVYISGAEVEQVNSFRFLRVSITKNLSCSPHIFTLVKKAQKQLYFLRKLKREKFPCQVLFNFYKASGLETLQTGMVCAWPRRRGLCSG